MLINFSVERSLLYRSLSYTISIYVRKAKVGEETASENLVDFSAYVYNAIRIITNDKI